MRKFKRAVTDSEGSIRRGEGKEGISNLITIYALATGKTPEEVEAEFSGKGYADFKPAVGEAVVELLRPIREKTEDLLKNKVIWSRFTPKAHSAQVIWRARHSIRYTEKSVLSSDKRGSVWHRNIRLCCWYWVPLPLPVCFRSG